MKKVATQETGLSEANAETLGKLLQKTEFPLPRPVFDGWVENLPHVALELAVIRPAKNFDWEIFLTRRDNSDKFWPGEWHMPGTIIHQNELILTAYQRLTIREVRSASNFGPVQFVKVHEFPKGEGRFRCRRGHEIALLHLVQFSGKNLPGGKFFHHTEVPQNTIGHHLTMLMTVARMFLSR